MSWDTGIPFALLAVLTFSSSAFFFRGIAARTSSLWLNTFKALVVFVAFSISAAVTELSGSSTGLRELAWPATVILLVSGVIGLNLSDWLMLNAYQRIGPARTIIVYRFQPLFLAILAFLAFGQRLNFAQLGGVLLLIGCIWVLALERRLTSGRWDIGGLGIALGAMALDGAGVILSRAAFDRSSDLTPVAANIVRALGALLGFAVLSRFRPIRLREIFAGMPVHLRWKALGASILGSVMGLFFWLNAVKVGHMATISSIGGISPLLAVLIESVLERRMPSRQVWIALVLSLVAFYLLVLGVQT